MPKLTLEQLEDLATIYRHVLIDAALLIEVAARKGSTVRAIYESIIDDLAQVEREIALAKRTGERKVIGEK